jgi:hypothetical protein
MATEMANLSCEIPASLKKRARVAAAGHDKTLKDLVAEALEQWCSHLEALDFHSQEAEDQAADAQAEERRASHGL